MAEEAEFLFGNRDIFSVVASQKMAIKKRVREIPANKVLNASEEDLVQALMEEFRLDVPVIREDDIHIAYSGEVQVDVSGDPRRMIYDPSQPFYIPGNKTVIAVPFSGDPEFFR